VFTVTKNTRSAEAHFITVTENTERVVYVSTFCKRISFEILKWLVARSLINQNSIINGRCYESVARGFLNFCLSDLCELFCGGSLERLSNKVVCDTLLLLSLSAHQSSRLIGVYLQTSLQILNGCLLRPIHTVVYSYDLGIMELVEAKSWL